MRRSLFELLLLLVIAATCSLHVRGQELVLYHLTRREDLGRRRTIVIAHLLSQVYLSCFGRCGLMRRKDLPTDGGSLVGGTRLKSHERPLILIASMLVALHYLILKDHRAGKLRVGVGLSRLDLFYILSEKSR